jgi:hypothetical protein
MERAELGELKSSSETHLPFHAQNGDTYLPPPNGWKYTFDRMTELDNQGRLHYPLKANGRLRLKNHTDEMAGVSVLPSNKAVTDQVNSDICDVNADPRPGQLITHSAPLLRCSPSGPPRAVS